MAGKHHPQHALAPRIVYVAVEDSKVVGYIAGHRTQRYSLDGELQYLFVSKPHRRMGVAAALLEHLAGWFAEQGASKICVNVNEDSPGARPFYTSRGATILSKHWMVWERPPNTHTSGPAQAGRHMPKCRACRPARLRDAHRDGRGPRRGRVDRVDRSRAARDARRADHRIANRLTPRFSGWRTPCAGVESSCTRTPRLPRQRDLSKS